MATKIRLQRHGRKGRPFYKIVVADARARRDGKFIERLGYYNPTSIPATIELNVDRSLEWLLKGAEPTDTARAILQYKGVLYKKHLMRGVAKGAFSEEEALKKFDQWVSEKEARVLDHQQQSDKQKAEKIRAAVEAGMEKAEARRKKRLERDAEEEGEELSAETEEAAVEAAAAGEEAAAEAVAEEAVAEEPPAEAAEATAETEVTAEAASEEEVQEATAEAQEESVEEAAPEAEASEKDAASGEQEADKA